MPCLSVQTMDDLKLMIWTDWSVQFIGFLRCLLLGLRHDISFLSKVEDDCEYQV